MCLNGTLPCVDFMAVTMGHITTLCLNGTLPCVDFMAVTMRHITTLCLNETLPCVDFMAVTMGHITTLCLNGTLPCVDFMAVTMGQQVEGHELCIYGSCPFDPPDRVTRGRNGGEVSPLDASLFLYHARHSIANGMEILVTY